MDDIHQQKNAFINYEADMWFKRNLPGINEYAIEQDPIFKVIKNYGIRPENILEIGSSAGYRLNGLKQEFPEIEAYGLEPSIEAINYGKSKYQDINFLHGTADNIQLEDGSMDMVIIGFVLYVIDRKLLLKVISEIDRVLKNKGFLLIVDFFTEKALRNKYHHINQFSAYTFKQEYDSLFCATDIYHLLDRTCYDHNNNVQNAYEDFQKMYAVSLLKKDIDAAYE